MNRVSEETCFILGPAFHKLSTIMRSFAKTDLSCNEGKNKSLCWLLWMALLSVFTNKLICGLSSAGVRHGGFAGQCFCPEHTLTAHVTQMAPNLWPKGTSYKKDLQQKLHWWEILKLWKTWRIYWFTPPGPKEHSTSAAPAKRTALCLVSSDKTK